MNGKHTELFTYDLYLDLLLAKQKKGELAHFSTLLHISVSGEWSEPWLHLGGQCGVGEIVLSITSQKGGYELEISNRAGGIPPELQAATMPTRTGPSAASLPGHTGASRRFRLSGGTGWQGRR